MVNLGFHSDNHGKKGWYTSFNLRNIRHPSTPGNVDPSDVFRSLDSSLNIEIWGVGKDMANSGSFTLY